MNLLSVNEVSKLLRENSIPEEVVASLADNSIDGAALLLLPEDFQEFQHLVPQGGIRLRIKGILQQNFGYTHDGFMESESTSLGFTTGELISSSLQCLSDFSATEPQGAVEHASPDPGDVHHDMQTAQLPETHTYTSPEGITHKMVVDGDPASTSRTSHVQSPLLARVKEERLPIPCPEPLVTPATREAAKDKLTGVKKLRLLREAATYYHGLCSRPTQAEYAEIAKTVCSNYPQLKDKKPIDGEYWASVKDYMSQRFRNLRRESRPIQPSSKKRKLITAAHVTPVAGAVQTPLTVEKDDSVAYERNKKLLLEEHLRQRPRDSTVRTLMKLTFHQRRDIINASTARTTEIVDDYPFFKAKKWVFHEFELMCGENAIQTIRDNWHKYVPIILGDRTTESAADSEMELLALQEIDRKLRPGGPGAKSLAAFTTYEPGTKLEDVLRDKSFPEPRLVIFTIPGDVANAQGFVVAEKTVLFEVDNFTVSEALIALIASYYVLFVSYPKSVCAAGLLLFVQEILLEQEDVSVKKTAKYTALVNSVLPD